MYKFFLLLLCLCWPAFGANFNVTQSGAGNHDGSSAGNAWSVSEFNSQTTLAGDTVLFTGPISSQVTPASNGSSTNRLKLDFTKATLNSSVQFRNRAFITAFGGNGGSFDFGGTLSHDITIEKWTYTGPPNGTGTFIGSNYVYNLTVSNCTIDNATLIWGDSNVNHDITITGCFARSSTNETKQTDVVCFGDAANVTIEKCKLIQRAPGNATERHNDVVQNYMKGGSNPGNPRNWVLRYNWIELQNTSGSGDASWLMFEEMAGDPALRIYSNVFLGSGTIGNNGIAVAFNSGGKYYLYNNTVIRKGNPDNTIRFLDGGGGTTYWRNNIGMANSGINGTFTDITMVNGGTDYNFFYRFGNQYAGAHGSTTKDPLFANYAANDFSLQANSPCRGAGDSSIGAEYQMGIAPGSSWPNPTLVERTGNWDCGAYVYPGGAPTPAPTPTPTPVPPKFKTGDYVKPIGSANIRETPAGPITGTHDTRDVGLVQEGPEVADLGGAPINWYRVTWVDDPTQGWTDDLSLEKTATPAPSPSPSPSPTATPTPAPTPTYGQWLDQLGQWIQEHPARPDH
jgi:hypothetical protein